MWKLRCSHSLRIEIVSRVFCQTRKMLNNQSSGKFGSRWPRRFNLRCPRRMRVGVVESALPTPYEGKRCGICVVHTV